MKSLKTGGEVDSWCTKCRLVLNHRIIAMVGPKPVRVECSTCSSHRDFRARPPGEKEAASPRSTKSGISEPRAPRMSSATKAEQARVTREVASREKAVTGRAVADFRKYTIHETFREGNLVKHTRFGDGVVTRIINADGIEILLQGRVADARTDASQGMTLAAGSAAPGRGASASAVGERPPADHPGALARGRSRLFWPRITASSEEASLEVLPAASSCRITSTASSIRCSFSRRRKRGSRPSPRRRSGRSRSSGRCSTRSVRSPSCAAATIRRKPGSESFENDELFKTVGHHLARGNLLIFPEGTSHNEPGLVKLRTERATMMLWGEGVARPRQSAFRRWASSSRLGMSFGPTSLCFMAPPARSRRWPHPRCPMRSACRRSRA